MAVSWVTTGSFYVANGSYLYYWFPTQAPVLACGLIFYFLRGTDLHRAHSIRTAVACFAAFLAGAGMAVYFGTAGHIAPILSPVILAIAFVFLISGMQGRENRIIVNKYAIALGRISFSVYILHFAVLDLLRLVIEAFHIGRQGYWTIVPIFITTLLITSGIALISKRIVEDPAIAYGHKLSKIVALGTRDLPEKSATRI